MAACASTLKPLVGRVLGLSSHAKYYQYREQRLWQRPQIRTDARLTSNRTANGTAKSPYELQERAAGGKENASVSTSTFYQHNGDSSEEEILRTTGAGTNSVRATTNAENPQSHDFRGIMRTTEVIVK